MSAQPVHAPPTGLADMAEEVLADIQATRPHNYSHAGIKAAARRLYGDLWYLDELVAAVEHYPLFR